MTNVRIEWNDDALKKATAPIQWDASKSESEQVAEIMKVLRARGLQPDRQAALQIVREHAKRG